jgi:hypothetical protein
MKRFTVSLCVTEDKLTTVISLLSGECTNLTVAEAARPAPIARRTSANVLKSSREDWATKYAEKLLSAMEQGRTYSIHDKFLHDLFPELKPASVGSLLSIIHNTGKLVRTSPGQYRKP